MPRKFVKARQCAVHYERGPRTGQQCGFPALQGSLYCHRHSSMQKQPHNPERLKKIWAGGAEFWRRVKEAAKIHPEIGQLISEQRARAARIGNQVRKDCANGVPRGDKVTRQARREVAELTENLPAVPDKPFEELTPDQQIVVNLGLSLKQLNRILKMDPIHIDRETKTEVIDYKLMAMIKDTALRTVAAVIKINANMMTAKRSDRMLDILERLKAEQEARTIEG